MRSEGDRKLFSITDRIRDLQRGQAPKRGCIGYINTDLYDYGVGLDLRESPKDLEATLAQVFVDRLHMYQAGREVKWHKDDPEDLVLLREDLIKRAVHELFELRLESLKYLRRDDLSYACSTELLKHESRVRSLSSGENEFLTFVLWFVGLGLRGSVVLLDEPELHLDPVRQYSLYRFLVASAEELENQVVVATHGDMADVGPSFVRYVYVAERDGTSQIIVDSNEVILRLEERAARIKNARHGFLTSPKMGLQEMITE